jgi:hypothetical protein
MPEIDNESYPDELDLYVPETLQTWHREHGTGALGPPRMHQYFPDGRQREVDPALGSAQVVGRRLGSLIARMQTPAAREAGEALFAGS